MKPVIFLYGYNRGKSDFDAVVKTKFWNWNVNVFNLLSITAKELGWDGEKDDQYFQFIDDLFTLAEKNFDVEYSYYKRMIEKLLAHDKANLMIIHSATVEKLDYFKAEFGGYSVYVARNKQDFDANVNLYDRVILKDDEFENNVLEFLDTLSK